MSTSTGYCTFPLCDRKEDRGGFCFLHAVHYAGEKVKETKKTVKQKTPLPKQSKKRKVEKKVYKKIIKAQVKKDDRCKVKSPVCTGTMEGMNHKQKRSPKNLVNEKNLTPSCNACNRYIEEHTEWARNHGHLISRFVKK